MREERAGDDVGALAGDQLVGDTHRVARARAVVARDHLELLAEHAALGVDLLDRELPALLVGIEEGRLCLVAVELADLERVLRQGRRAETDDDARRGQQRELISGAHAVLRFTSDVMDGHFWFVVPAKAGTHIPEACGYGPPLRGGDSRVKSANSFVRK